MSQIFDDLQGVFRRKDDVLTQLLVVNIVVFVVVGALNVFLFLSSANPGTGQVIKAFLSDNLMLSSDLSVVLRHPWTLITYFFTHQDFWHLVMNLLFLFWFGQLIQEYIGSARLLSLYIYGGVAGGLLYLLAYNALPAFAPFIGSKLLGASGACYAIVVGAATLLPNYCFSLLFIGSVRIVYIAVAYVLLSFLGIDSANPGGNLAHLGGAAMGYFFIVQLRRGHDLGKPLHSFLGFIMRVVFRRKALRVSYARPKFEPVSPSGRASAQKQSSSPAKSGSPQTDVDAILDKMLESGYSSLTAEEKRKLDAAGQDPS